MMESELLYRFTTFTDGISIYLGYFSNDKWYICYIVRDYNTPYEEYMPVRELMRSLYKNNTILREPKQYKKCLNCSHDVFIKRYSSYNKKLKISETAREMMLFRDDDFGDVDCIICEKCNEKFEK